MDAAFPMAYLFERGRNTIWELVILHVPIEKLSYHQKLPIIGKMGRFDEFLLQNYNQETPLNSRSAQVVTRREP